MTTLKSFFESYRRALEVGDIAAVARHYDLPLAVTYPDRTVMVSERTALEAALVRILDTYLWAGMARLDLVHFEEVGFNGSLGIVNVSWQPRDASGTSLTLVDTSYLMRTGETGLLIGGVVPHNEEERRMPLVARDAT